MAAEAVETREAMSPAPMRLRCALGLVTVLCASCFPPPPSLPRTERFATTSYVVGDTVQATIGAPLIRTEEGRRYEGTIIPISSFSTQLLYGGLAG